MIDVALGEEKMFVADHLGLFRVCLAFVLSGSLKKPCNPLSSIGKVSCKSLLLDGKKSVSL